MNQSDKFNGEVVNRDEYIRGLISKTESELAIIDQEETILGYMAKLVSLDAMALSEESLNAEIADGDIPPSKSAASSVNLFIRMN
jgi:hypothetical protein